MVRGKELSDNEKAHILGLRKASWTVRAIANDVKRSVGVIHKVLSSSAPFKKAKRSGRPRKVTERTSRSIVRSVSTQNLSASKVKAKLSLECSVRTIQRVLHGVDWLQYKKIKACPRRTKAHMQKRFEWCDRMACASDVQWANMIFSDEKKWNLDGPDGLRYQWVDKRNPEHVNMRRHTGGGSVMVWGGFCKSGKSELKFLNGRQNSEAYISTLQTHLQPFIQSGTQIFQQDNAAVHTSRCTLEWISSQSISIIDWPALSPDLNPIENLWGIMAQRVYVGGRQYDRIEDLKRAILSAWNEIPNFILQNLIESMRRRCIKVLKARGGYISY